MRQLQAKAAAWNVTLEETRETDVGAATEGRPYKLRAGVCRAVAVVEVGGRGMFAAKGCD